MFSKSGMVFGDEYALSLLSKMATKINDWGSTRKLTTQTRTMEKLRRNGYTVDVYFDAAHGRRHILLAYRDYKQRADLLDWFCSPANS